MVFGIDELLSQMQEGEGCHSDDEGEVGPPQCEDLTLMKSSCHWFLAH